MRKKSILSRLAATIKMLENLPDENFDYSRYMNTCGTVGCVAGWYTKFFPDAGLFLAKDDDRPKDGWIGLTTEGSVLTQPKYLIKYRLSLYHGLPTEIIDYLFFGRNFFPTNTDLPNFYHLKGDRSDRKSVIMAFLNIYDLLKNYPLKYIFNGN